MRDGSLYRVEAADIPRALMEKYDQRRFGPEGIQGNLAKWGETLETATPRQLQAATFASRADKAVGQERKDFPQKSLEEYQAHWQEQSRAWGYEPSLFSTKPVEVPRIQIEPVAPSLLDEAMQRIVDNLQAARAEVFHKTHALNAARENGDKARISVIGAELAKARAELAPKSEKEFAAVIRTEKGVKYASQAEISAAIERALDKAQLLEHGNGKLSIETEREFDRRVAMTAAADRGYAQFEVNKALSLTIEAQATGPARADLHVAQAQEALAKQDLDGFGRAASELRDARPTFTPAQVVLAIRAEVPHAKPENLERALEQATSAGAMQARESRQGTRYSFESADQAATRDAVSSQAVRIALDKVIANQAEKLDRVQELTAAIKTALATERAQAIAQAAEKAQAKEQPSTSVAEAGPLTHDQAYAKAQDLVADLASGRKTLADLGTGAEVISRQDTQAIAEALQLPKLEQGGAVAEAIQIQQYLTKAPTVEDSRALTGQAADVAGPQVAPAQAERVPMPEVADALKGAMAGKQFETVQELAGAIHSSLASKDAKLADDLAATVAKAAEKGMAPEAAAKAVTEVLDHQRGLTSDALVGAVDRKLEGRQTSVELANELKAATAEVAKSEAGWAKAIRAEVPGASQKDVSAAIQGAVADGKLQGIDTKYGQALTIESAAQSNDRRLTEKAVFNASRDKGELSAQYDRAAIAADRVVSRMEAARDTVQARTEDLAKARAMRDDKAIEKAQSGLKEANKELAGLTVAGFDREVRKEMAALERNAAPELGDTREAKGEAYAAKLAASTAAAFEKAGVPLSVKTNTPSVQVSQDVLDAVRKDALSQGRLHENAGKLSVETEKQTTVRLEGNREASKDYRSAVQKDKYAAEQEQRIERQAERQAKSLEQKAERLQGKPLEARQRENWPTYTKTVNNTKAVIQAITNPKVAAQRLAIGALKSVGVQAATLGATAANALAAAATTSVSALAKGREHAMAQAKGEQMTLGKQMNVTKLSTAGFHITQTGEVHRMKVNVSNGLLTLGVKALEASQLTRTSVGMSVRNELLKGITTKRVDGLEAWTVKAIAGTAKALSAGMTKVAESKLVERISQSKPVQGYSKALDGFKAQTPEEKFAKAFMAAAKDYSQAKEEFRLGTIGEKEFRAEHAKFEQVVKEGRELNRETFEKATATYESKMRDVRIDREAFAVKEGILANKGQGLLDKALSVLDAKEPEKREARDPEIAKAAEERFANREQRAGEQYSRAITAYQEKEAALVSALPSADQAVKAIEKSVELDAARNIKTEAVALKSIGEADLTDIAQARDTIQALKTELAKLPTEREQDRAIAKVLGVSDRELHIAMRDAVPEKSIGQAEQKVAEQVEILNASGADKSKAVSLEQPAEKAANQVEQAVARETKNLERGQSPDPMDRTETNAGNRQLNEHRKEEARKAGPETLQDIKERLAQEGRTRSPSRGQEHDLSL